ncbi:MAG: nucleotide exchange factor GrpE [Patescibacteria group bacterium]
MSKEIKKTENMEEETNFDDAVDDVIIESENEEINSLGDKTANKLREKLKTITAEKQEYLAGWQRARADLINAKKEFNEERVKMLKFANADLITQIIPVLDSLEMSFASGKTDDVENFKEWVTGVKHIYSQLLAILKENGVEQTEPLNEKFDPALHIAMENIKIDDEQNNGIIMEVIQKGYSLNGKIIREAKVKVGEFQK